PRTVAFHARWQAPGGVAASREFAAAGDGFGIGGFRHGWSRSALRGEVLREAFDLARLQPGGRRLHDAAVAFAACVGLQVGAQVVFALAGQAGEGAVAAAGAVAAVAAHAVGERVLRRGFERRETIARLAHAGTFAVGERFERLRVEI